MEQDPQVSLDSLTERARTFLAEAFRSHGLEPRTEEGVLYLGAGPLAAWCAVERYRSYPSGDWMVQLTVEIAPGIRDTRAGLGGSPDEALVEVIMAWLHGTFAPILAALCGTQDETLRTAFGLEGPRYLLDVCDPEGKQQTTWEAYAGPFQIRGTDGDRKVLAERLEESPPLMTLLLNLLTDFLGEVAQPVVWLKLFLHRNPDGTLVSECKLNSEDWTPGIRRLSEFSWPETSGGSSSEGWIAALRRDESGPTAGPSGPVSFQQFVVLTRGDSRT